MAGLRGYRDIGISIEDAAAVMKKVYATDTNLYGKMYEGSPTYQMIKRLGDGQGESYRQPFKIGTANGVSADFAEAYKLAVNQNVGPSFSAAEFTWDNFYAHYAMDVKQKKQMPSRGKGSFISAMRKVTDSTLERFQRLRLLHLYGDGSGALGQIKTNVTAGDVSNVGGAATVEIEIKNPTSMIYLEVGTQLQVAATATTTTPVRVGSAALFLEIVSVDRTGDKIVARTITDAGALVPLGGQATAANLVTALQRDRYLFEKGDLVQAPTNPNGTRFMPGFGAWIPINVTRTDNFWNINRSRDRFRQAGASYTALTGDDKWERTISQAAYKHRTRGGWFPMVVMNPLDFEKFVAELVANRRFPREGMTGATTAVGGFNTIKLNIGSKGSVKIYEDIHCPVGRGYGWNPKSWCIISLDKFIHNWDEDGRVLDRVAEKNIVTGAFHSYATMICTDPKDNAVFTLPTS